MVDVVPDWLAVLVAVAAVGAAAAAGWRSSWRNTADSRPCTRRTSCCSCCSSWDCLGCCTDWVGEGDQTAYQSAI